MRLTLILSFSLAVASSTTRAAAQDDATHRIEELERKLQDQQKELDSLKGREEKKPAAPTVDEKGAVNEASAAKPPEARPFEWGFNDGFFVKGKIGGSDCEIRPRAKIELDYRAFPHSHQNPAGTPAKTVPEDQFLLRRAWVGFSGRFSVFSFDLEANPTAPSSQLPLGDFWFQWDQLEELRVRVGHLRVPFGLESGMTGFPYLDCIERAMVIGSGPCVAPDLHPGVQVFGKLADGLVQYWFGMTNQQDSSSVATGDPLSFARVESDVRGMIYLGVSGLWTRYGGAVQNSFPGRSPGQFQFFSPVGIRGWEQVYGADAAFYDGPFWSAVEYVWAQQERNRVLAGGADGTPLITQGGYVTLGWKLAGPVAESKGPHAPFADWSWFSLDIVRKKNARNVGLELLVRLEWVNLDDARGGRRIDPATGQAATASTAANAAKVKGGDAKAVTVGINIDVIENVRLMVDYVHVRFGDERRAERAHSRHADELLFRAQLEF